MIASFIVSKSCMQTDVKLLKVMRRNKHKLTVNELDLFFFVIKKNPDLKD